MEQIIEDFLSLNNFHKAWLKVAENKGNAGVDNETIASFAKNKEVNLAQLKDAVERGTYQASPCKQVLISKKSGGLRELKIPTVRDRIVQQALLNVIYPLVEPKFSAASFAYRPNLSYVDAVKKVAEWRDRGYEWVLDADIVKFFDNLEHSRLLKEFRSYLDNSGVLCLIKNWIKAGTVTEKGVIFALKGIPQGAVISPLLANIYLNEFDWLIEASELKLVRYADDFLVLAKTQRRLIEASVEVTQILKSMGLEIHPQKSQMTSFREGFRFLGHGFLEQAIFPLESEKETKSTSKKKASTKNSQLTQEINGKLNISLDSDISELNKISYQEQFELSPQPQTRSPMQGLNEISYQEQFEINLPCQFIWNKEMATIYLTEQGTNLYKDHLRFIVATPDKKRLEVMIKEVKMILVFGNIQLSTAVISICLENDIMILFMNQSGQYKGHLWSLTSTNLEMEAVQLEKHKKQEFQSPVTKAIIYGKLFNSKQLLVRLNRKRKIAEIERAIVGIDSDMEKLNHIDEIDVLRGYEGIGAARYFPAFGELIINPNFSFRERFRQPPTDPVNSLLSFGYTLLFNNVFSMIIAEGLSPYLGNLHYGEAKKAYLAFDLMEEFRSPIVDSMVLKMVNTNVFKPEDFDKVPSNQGVYLKDIPRKTFFKHFENRLNEEVSHPDLQSSVTYRQAIQLQVRRYKRYLLASIPYEAFVRAV